MYNVRPHLRRIPKSNVPTIAVVCHVDAGRTGQHLANALHRGGWCKVSYVTRASRAREIAMTIGNADIIWVKGDTPAKIVNHRFTLLNSKGTAAIANMTDIKAKPHAKLILSPGGSSFRRPIDGYTKAYGLAPLEMFYENASLVAPITPDLNYPILNGVYLPHAIDEKNMHLSWKRGDEFTIGAYVGQCDSKHVKTVLIPAVELAREKGCPINLVITNGVSIPNAEFIKKMRAYTLYYDQVNPLGVYGRSGVEAMSMGIPIIVGITDTAIAQAAPIKNYGDPCLRAYDAESLSALIERAYNREIDLDEISARSKRYASEVHSYESIANYVKHNIISRVM